MDNCKFTDLFEFKKKSSIKAGAGLPKGEYPFFTSSKSLSKYLDSYEFDKPSLIFGTGGNANIHLSEIPFSTSTDCLVAQLKNKNDLKINIKFIYYFFLGNMWILEKGFKGAGLRHISKEYINNINVPVKPYNEQIKIINSIENIINIRQKRAQAINLLDEYIRSIFLSMFGDPIINPKKWNMMKIEDISESRLGKMRDKQYITGNYLQPYLGNSNVKWFHFDLSFLEEMDFDENEKNKYSLEYGDLLICEGGEIGRCAIWKKEIKNCYFQKALHRVRTDKEIILPEYLQWVLWFYSKGDAFKESRAQATIAHLTGEKLKRLQIPIADIKLQNKFAGISLQVEKSKQKMVEQSSEIENQFQALMHKSFASS